MNAGSIVGARGGVLRRNSGNGAQTLDIDVGGSNRLRLDSADNDVASVILQDDGDVEATDIIRQMSL